MSRMKRYLEDRIEQIADKYGIDYMLAYQLTVMFGNDPDRVERYLNRLVLMKGAKK